MSLDLTIYAVRRTEVYSGNITHNLVAMAKAAGVYECLWHPKDNGYETAFSIIDPLKSGLEKLKVNPRAFDCMNASNGWGTRQDLIDFIERTLEACIGNPDGELSTWT